MEIPLRVGNSPQQTKSNGFTNGSGEHTFAWDLTESKTKDITIAEILKPGYLFNSYSCSNQESGQTLPSTTFTISQGENVTCTFNNETIRKSLSIAQEELAEVKVKLRQLVETDIPAFEAKLEAAGVPWTQGRGVPGS